MDAADLELPLQIEEVVENLHEGECVAEPQGGGQALGSRSRISLGPREALAPGDVGSSAVPCGDTDGTVALEERNYCGLAEPQTASSPASRPRKGAAQSPGTLHVLHAQLAYFCENILKDARSEQKLVAMLQRAGKTISQL